MEGKVGASNLGVVQGSTVFTKPTIMFHMLDSHVLHSGNQQEKNP